MCVRRQCCGSDLLFWGIYLKRNYLKIAMEKTWYKRIVKRRKHFLCLSDLGKHDSEMGGGGNIHAFLRKI